MAFLSILGILFHSCEKEIVDDITQVVRDHLTAENVFNDVGIIVEIGMITVKHNRTENKPHPCFK